MNQFYNPKVLKPRSSFQKLGMYIIILNGERFSTLDNSHEISSVPLQMFEFNSIVPLGISELPFAQPIPNKKLEYSIKLRSVSS